MNLTFPQFSIRLSFHHAFLLIFCCFSPTDPAAAQNLDNVAIGGRVIDQNGAVIPGASVTALLKTTGSQRTTVTDSDGRYRILQLEPGAYALRTVAAGFAMHEMQDLPTVSGQQVQVEITLMPQGVVMDQVVVVSGEAQSVDTTRTVVGGTVTAREIESLPGATRSALDLIFTLGGVTEESLSTRDLAEDRDRNPAGTPEEAGTFAISAGELVRFVFASSDANPNSVVRRVEFGVPVSLVNLNSLSSTTSVEVALAALNDLRPDATRAEVEQLIAAGNSFYQGLMLVLRKELKQRRNNLGLSFRVAYTFADLVDDGVVNTSDALVPGDFRRERARSLLDRKHRFVFSGTFDLPAVLGKVSLSPILRIASGAPFNISIGGVDRNLDDVSNDRPNFIGNTEVLRWRGPNDPIDPSILSLFALPTIGQSGNLPRNAGRGPGLFLFDLSVTREFRFTERIRFRPVIEFDNVLNKTVFSFGAEFINFNALAPTATAEQQQAFLDSFLVTTRTLRPRQIRLGIRIDF